MRDRVALAAVASTDCWRYKLYMHCPNRGFPIDRRNLPAVCPKCDEDLVRAKASKPLVACERSGYSPRFEERLCGLKT